MSNSLYPEIWSESEIMQAFAKVLESGIVNFKEPATPENLARKAAWRVYTEWCMDPKGGNNKDAISHYNYHGEALESFLNDEKLWEVMDPNRGKNRITENYQAERERVLNAFARSTCNFFLVHCVYKEGIYEVMNGDKINMRRSLQPWLDNPNFIL